tara:strand:+ start:11630 stop:12631 length:1002 start_codon:yes stop_codon:yes gene_type:complete
MKKLNIAVVGATGAVGETILQILEQRDFPFDNLYPLASSRSAGKTVTVKGQDYVIEDLAEFDFAKADMALFSAGGSISAEYAPKAAAKKCLVIDNTSHFRQDKDVPLVVPEVNPEDLAHYKDRYIIANPNCSTIQMLVALKPIHDAVSIERINVCTYQAVSGSGKVAIDELMQQVEDSNAKPNVYDKPIAFNVLPHIDVFLDNGYTKEEMKMVWETQKMLHDDNIKVNPTAVRVPVTHGHSEAIHIETKTKITKQQAEDLLRNAPGVQLMTDDYPTALTDAAGQDAVFVGRIREDISHPNGLNLWVVADNIRKGAALNAVQIAEIMHEKFLQN